MREEKMNELSRYLKISSLRVSRPALHVLRRRTQEAISQLSRVYEIATLPRLQRKQTVGRDDIGNPREAP